MDWEQKRTDQNLTAFYEGSGLFAKIIDTPSEECFRCGFKILGNVPNDGIENAVDLLDWLQWDDTATAAVKWARLYGGSIIVMLINDGGNLEEPLKLEKVCSVDGLKVYDRSIVRPCPAGSDGSSGPMPEHYQVFSRNGTFTVHASRCLIFRNGGELTETSVNRQLWPWGIPEAYRIAEALQNTEVAHGSAVRLLEKAIQPVHKIHGLAQMLETPEGEERVRRQIEISDFSRGLWGTIAIDRDDDFSFHGEIPEGIGKLVRLSGRMLSAVTGIPEVILWGRLDYEKPGQLLRKKDNVSMENWYSFVGRIQTGMVKNSLWRLLSIIFQAEVNSGNLPRLPKFDIEFLPLWSADDLEMADIQLAKAKQRLDEAKTAEMYVKMGSLKPSEIRKGLFRKSRRR